jgi:DNA mismatch repair protein MutS
LDLPTLDGYWAAQLYQFQPVPHHEPFRRLGSDPFRKSHKHFGSVKMMSPQIITSSGGTPATSFAHERSTSVSFRSILFEDSEIAKRIDKQEAPEFITDLNLDQVVDSITAGRDEYNLKPFFYTPVNHIESINYRYDIQRDLENRDLLGCIRSFAQEMRTMRDHLVRADKLYYKYQKQSWFLDAIEIYCSAVRRLSNSLMITELRSRAFLTFRDYLKSYTESDDFIALFAETRKLKADLSGIRYSLLIEGKRITVSRYNSESDYGADVLRTFEKFKQGAPKEYRFEFPSAKDMNHIEAAILDLVARLHPEIFSLLNEYCSRHSGYLDSTIVVFDREVQFYIAYLEYIERFKRAGLPFCYPTVIDQSKEVYGFNVFDLGLASPPEA